MPVDLPEDRQPLAERLQDLRRAAPGFWRRQVKTARQARYGWRHDKQITFVFGCQRSGTKMLMRVLDHSPAIRIFHENHASAFQDFQLRADGVLRALVALNPAPAQVFKPICDSHKADLLLDRFDDARGLWIYRHYDDVANSADVKWGDHQRQLADAVAKGELDTWGWRTERLPPEVIADIRRVWRPDLTPSEGALLFWYLRNSFFFTLDLPAHPRVHLVRYEDLVTRPEPSFARVFQVVGAPFDPSLVAGVRSTSVGRRPAPAASPEIRALCQGLLERLDAVAATQVQAWTPPPPRPLTSPVLVLNNTLGVGGAERYIVTVANWLAAHGSRVVVAAEHGPMVDQLDPAVRFVDVPLARVRADLPRAARQVRRLIEQERPAAIVANSLAVTWVARAAQGRRRVPIVNVAHGWPADRYTRVGPLMRIADAVVAVSPEVKRKLVAGGLDEGRCTVIFNGVDCAPFHPRQGPARDQARAAMGAGPDDLLVVNLGRLSAQKAHQHVVEIARRLRQELPSLRFAVIGEGERQDELQARIDDQDLADRVRLMGRRMDVAELLGAADLFLSTSDWEGMPLSMIEGMASGLPVVATATEGVAELLDAESGVVVPVGDVAAMASAVADLARDPDRRRHMGQAARDRALARFSHDRMVSELEAVLARVGGARR
ncbi:glycosyltransferase [Myxococcota bacterium]|nr:glycosyltransferase [Myxococcota bacterium]